MRTTFRVIALSVCVLAVACACTPETDTASTAPAATTKDGATGEVGVTPEKEAASSLDPAEAAKLSAAEAALNTALTSLVSGEFDVFPTYIEPALFEDIASKNGVEAVDIQKDFGMALGVKEVKVKSYVIGDGAVDADGTCVFAVAQTLWDGTKVVDEMRMVAVDGVWLLSRSNFE